MKVIKKYNDKKLATKVARTKMLASAEKIEFGLTNGETTKLNICGKRTKQIRQSIITADLSCVNIMRRFILCLLKSSLD